MKIKIQDLKPGMVKGVQVHMPNAVEVYEEKYFKWSKSTLLTKFGISEITGGILTAWHHQPAFNEIEYHNDNETFYFLNGEAIMLFIDIKENEPDMSSAQLVRVKEGTHITISAGKGHFVPVSTGNTPVQIAVVSPEMAAPRIKLAEIVEGCSI
jgi:oxalate decarboxylase/phosphoglucose isomerase-like protein (cupin superfamily)